MCKYIFITGGVVSGLGKGITAASIGALLQARGYTVTIMKMDPYVNVDAGTMSPLQHGEVFVTDDGAETDLDLGHYERFIDRPLTAENNITTGQVYGAVIAKERNNEFRGSTVQVIPHVTDEIKRRIQKVADKSQADVILIEVGGTVGDIESLPFLEAIRQFKADVGSENTAYLHVTLIPHLPVTGELKTKPTQHSVAELRSIGIQPDIIVCRSSYGISEEMKRKIALFCSVDVNAVISNLDAGSIYEAPVMLENEGLGKIVEKELNFSPRKPDLSEWEQISYKLSNPKAKCKVAVVGKYVSIYDAYRSVCESLEHGGLANDAKVEIVPIDSDGLSKADDEQINGLLGQVDGILVPGGFRSKSIDGKLKTIKWAREKQVPFLGICFGFQCAVIEIARNELGLLDANSTEINPDTLNPVVDLLPEHKGMAPEAVKMRKGLYECSLKESSIPWKAYGQKSVFERHRHKYELNPMYIQRLSGVGLIPVGVWPSRGLIEILELQGHPWFLGTLFRPEFLSRPNRPHPIFKDFIGAVLKHKRC